LYDLDNDLGEANNIAEREKEIVSRLTKDLLQWHAAMPADNGPQLGEAVKAKAK